APALAALTKYFLRLGTFGFGGPIALTAAMQRDLVLRRRWVTVEEYKQGLALAQLAPGPLAAQLAMYIGWVRWGLLGATVGGLAVVPFLHGGAVGDYGWLTERQFLDAVAVSMITPGPVVITVAFIGYLVAGPLGGLVAAVGMFLPTYLAVVLAAPSFHRVMASRHLKA